VSEAAATPSRKRFLPVLVAVLGAYPAALVLQGAARAPSAFAKNVLEGVSLGGVYALIALGYTMVYGVLGLINFAHSDVFMMGAYVGLFTASALGFASNYSGPSSPVVTLVCISCAMVACTARSEAVVARTRLVVHAVDLARPVHHIDHVLPAVHAHDVPRVSTRRLRP